MDFSASGTHWAIIARGPGARRGAGSAKIFARYRAIELADAQRAQYLGIHEPRIDPHAIQLRVHSSPVGQAAASFAAMKVNRALAPRVSVGGTRWRGYPDLFRRIVGPERAIAAANRTIAVGQRLRRASDLQVD